MKTWLFNPFTFVAGWAALFAGLATILATALLAWLGHIHLDGIIDLHEGNVPTFGICLFEGLTNWLCMGLFAYLAGLVFSGSSIRLVDAFGTQALARAPMLLSCLASIALSDPTMLRYIEYHFLQKGEPVTPSGLDFARFGCMILADISLTIWTVVLMYRAYSTSCNLKGQRGMFTFIAALIAAEILSKIIFSYCI